MFIKYISTPGFFYKFNGKSEEEKGFFLLTPYLDAKTKTFNKIIPSGKFLIILGMRNGIDNSTFICKDTTYIHSNPLKADFINYDFDLSLYLDFNNNINSANLEEKKGEVLQNIKRNFIMKQQVKKLNLNH